MTGLPDGVDYVLAAVAEIILNLYLLARFSSDVVAAIGITEGINNVPALVAEGLVFFAVSVFGRSVGRLLAANEEHTQERRAELSRTLMKVFRMTAIIAFSTGVTFAVFAQPLTCLFLEPGESEAVRELTVRMTVFFSLGFGFATMSWIFVCYYQVVSAYFLAHIATFAEEILFYLLLNIALVELFGIDGIVLAMLLSNVLLFLFNLCLVWWANRRFLRGINDFRLDRFLDRLKEEELSEKQDSV